MSHPVTTNPTPPGHETTDMDPRTLVVSGVVLLVMMLLAIVAMAVMLGRFEKASAARQTPRSPVAAASALPPEPRLQVRPSADLAEVRAAEHARLASYGWVDEAGGVAHVPLERAFELELARRGAAKDGATP